MKANIVINGIVKESEKAICLNCLVSYNDNTPKERAIWMPRSVAEAVNDNLAKVEDWFLDKLSRQNAFRGYTMNFERWMN